MRKPIFAYAKTKVQIRAQLISTFVFAIKIVQSLYFLNLTFQVSNHLLWLNSTHEIGFDGKTRKSSPYATEDYNLVLYNFSTLFMMLYMV